MNFCKHTPLLFVSSLLLFSCSQKQADVPKLAPEEVLARSATAVRSLQSSEFAGTLNFSMRDAGENASTLSGEATLTGILQDSGESVSLMVDATVRSTGDESAVLKLKGEMVSVGTTDVYLRLANYAVEEGQGPLSPEIVSRLQGQWWHLPAAGDAEDGLVPVTPDPGLLKAQAEVVRVVEDKGVTTLNGIPVYRYAVTADKEKLVAFLRNAAKERSEEFSEEETRAALEQVSLDGELFIDAENFFVRRISWTIRKGSEAEGQALTVIAFQVDFSKHNEAAAVVPPADAQLFSPMLLLGGNAALPALGGTSGEAPAALDGAIPDIEGMTPEQREALIESILGEGGEAPSVLPQE